MDISYSELSQNLKKTIDFVSDRHEPQTETSYLLRNSAMAKRLINAVTDIKSGKVIQRGLIDEA